MADYGSMAVYWVTGSSLISWTIVSRSCFKTSVRPHQGSSSAFAWSVFHRARRSWSATPPAAVAATGTSPYSSFPVRRYDQRYRLRLRL